MIYKHITASLFAILLGLQLHTGQAAVELVPEAPALNAKTYLLMDYHSGRILAEHDIDKRVEPASLTKLMTAYVVMNELKNGTVRLDDEVLISEKAWRMKGSRMFVEVNTRVPVRQLMMGMIVQSGNDATVALAEHTAGSEETFATLMNKHAANLGMVNSNFVNSTGWPDKNHYTTARDLGILAHAMIRDFPKYYPWYSTKEYSYNNITQPNRNLLLWRDERVDGMKTGHTESAGFCLITSAKQDNMRLISVITGSSSEQNRARASQKLIAYGFRFYETFLYHAADEAVTETQVWKGESDKLALGLAEPLFITTPRGMKDKITTDIKLDEETIIAPVTRGKRYAQLHIKLGETTIAERPLVAAEDIPSGGMFSRAIDYVRMMFN